MRWYFRKESTQRPCSRKGLLYFQNRREQSEREERNVKEACHTACRNGFNTKCNRKPLKGLKA